MDEVVHSVLRLVDALENIASEMEQMRLLKEHELGVRVEYGAGGDSYVRVDEERSRGEGGRESGD